MVTAMMIYPPRGIEITAATNPVAEYTAGRSIDGLRQTAAKSPAAILPADGQGLPQLREAPGVRKLAEPFDGRDPAALQPESPEGPNPGRGGRDPPRLCLRALPEVEQGDEGRLGSRFAIDGGHKIRRRTTAW
jgi:hypothetical protein